MLCSQDTTSLLMTLTFTINQAAINHDDRAIAGLSFGFCVRESRMLVSIVGADRVLDVCGQEFWTRKVFCSVFAYK